jgi:hypothetical protein
MQKAIQFGLIAFLIFFIVTSPDSASRIIHNIINGLGDLGHGMSDFVSSL